LFGFESEFSRSPSLVLLESRSPNARLRLSHVGLESRNSRSRLFHVGLKSRFPDARSKPVAVGVTVGLAVGECMSTKLGDDVSIVAIDILSFASKRSVTTTVDPIQEHPIQE
jgi:hypothetical protein